MAAPVFLLKVGAAWPVPGLGLLLLPAGPTPHLRRYPLHHALRVAMVLPDGRRWSATATVEEVRRTETPECALLLEAGADLPELPPGTAIWQLE